ncbi:hypothetical protein [Rhodococcoides fascians]|nr:hypothetical protein [Rhodococcus fascians]
MNYRAPFLAAAVLVAAAAAVGAAAIAYVLAVDIASDEQTLTEKS